MTDRLDSQASLSGIVITHGIDTMEETAYFLDLTVAGDRPIVLTGSMRPLDMPGADAPANLLNAVKVDIVYSYAGADSVAIDALVAAGAKGLVIAGVGKGNMPAEQGRAVERATKRGVIVVVTTRTGSGAVPTEGLNGLIGAGDLNAQKARVLLMLALTRTNDPAQVASTFEKNQ